MKVEFTAVTRLDEKITSNCIIQKVINNELIIYLGIKGHWKLIKNETLEIELCKDNQ
jgi:hypothetical protein